MRVIAQRRLPGDVDRNYEVGIRMENHMEKHMETEMKTWDLKEYIEFRDELSSC